jgi:uridylate kinase
MPEICQSFSQRAALHHVAKGRVVIYAGGTGNPFFTTDSAAALRAAEMGAEAILKGTQVDGIYSADPKLDPAATRFERLTHDEVLQKGLAVMDVAAVSLARENAIPIVVFSIHEKGGLAAILRGGGRSTVVSDR